nr:hypothetical protein [Mesorhizobium sp.]
MNWTDAEAALESGVASVFDTGSFRVLPKKAGVSVNQTPVADTGRAEFDFAGTLDLGPPFLPSGRGNAGDPAARDRAVAYEGVLTAHRAGWPHVPRRGDVIRNLATDEDWTIMTSEIDGSARAAFNVNRLR